MQCIDFNRYIDAFHVLERYSEEYPFMLDHLLKMANDHYPGGLSLLDIGAGTGRFTRSFLENCKAPVHSYTAIEPSLDHVNQLQENLRHLSIEKEIIPAFFGPQTMFDNTFDLILLSHSTYCFLPDPEPFLLNAFTFLKEGGRAVIYHGSPSNFCNLLNLIYNDELPVTRVVDPTFTSWDVRDILEKNGISHTVSYLPGFLRAGEIFQPGNDLLLRDLITFSFMVEAESLRPGMLARAKELLRQLAYPSREGPLLNLGVDAIVVGPLSS
jgi:SAM-dependent methyltransferase